MSDSSARDGDNAYLIIRQGGKWTDVLRLLPGKAFVIGRSSQSQVVIRSDQCSRAHAELQHIKEQWIVRDLGSRNGTVVNGETIKTPAKLREQDVISVAGYQMTFVRQVADAFSSDAAPLPPQNRGQPTELADTQVRVNPADSLSNAELETLRQATNSQPSQPLVAAADGQRSQNDRAQNDRAQNDRAQNDRAQNDRAQILDRRRRSAILEPGDLELSRSAMAASSEASLLRTAFALARGEAPEQVSQIALEALNRASGTAAGAVLVATKKQQAASSAFNGLTALATSSRPGHSYRSLSEKLASTVLTSGEAILARNIEDDLALASRDSQGELSTTSALCAPIVISQKVVGLLHIYSSKDEPELTSQHLELALAIAANLALALEHLWRERQLKTNLRRSEQQLAKLREQLGEQVFIVGESEPILEIQRQVARAAPTAATVLVRGESGVGKELIAAAIHHASPRRNGPFVCLNCAALSPSLLESELFGHEKGAFTGATERKIGKFEAADGGTLMLDEIGEMSPEIQSKFLRVLEGQAFERVGGNTAIRVDVRVVAATNRDLEVAVREGKFRSDLYFRLNVVELRVPPLRERGSDVLLLAEHFLTRFRSEMGRRLDAFSQTAKQKLMAYHWPGNIRELKNAVERAVVLCPGPKIEADDLLLSNLTVPGQPSHSQPSQSPVSSEGAQSAQPLTANSSPPASTAALYDDDGNPLTLALLERQHIERVLQHTAGNKSQAARLLGIERSTLDRKIKRFESE
ncbi:sigma 54-interacting transcriptional regulator [Planctomycetaceae bacterium SH139]